MSRQNANGYTATSGNALLSRIHGVALVIPLLTKSQKKEAAHRVCAGLLALINSVRKA